MFTAFLVLVELGFLAEIAPKLLLGVVRHSCNGCSRRVQIALEGFDRRGLGLKQWTSQNRPAQRHSVNWRPHCKHVNSGRAVATSSRQWETRNSGNLLETASAEPLIGFGVDRPASKEIAPESRPSAVSSPSAALLAISLIRSFSLQSSWLAVLLVNEPIPPSQ